MSESKHTPVADHIEHRLRTWRQQQMNRSGDRLALDDFMGAESIDDLVDFVCDEHALDAVLHRAPDLAAEVDRLQRRMDLAAGALADIAISSDMTLEVARAKAARIYAEITSEKP